VRDTLRVGLGLLGLVAVERKLALRAGSEVEQQVERDLRQRVLADAALVRPGPLPSCALAVRLAARADRVREAAPAYRPRHPERTALYRLFERHWDDYARAHEERFEPSDGPLRPVVEPAVHAYLDCGRLHGGFARIRCPRCKGEHLLAFSCQTRNFCPSCQGKRAALFAERFGLEIAAPKQPLARYSGAYANRVRKLYRAAEGEERGSGGTATTAGPPDLRDEDC